MSGVLRHAVQRLVATVRNPGALLVVLLTGAATLVLWPGPMPASGPVFELAGEQEPAAVATLLAFTWLWLWPALAAPAIAGRAAVAGGGSGLFVAAHPALPVSARSRAVAEVAVLGLLVTVGRLPGFFLGGWAHDTFALPGEVVGGAAWAASFATHTVLGFVIAVPVVLAWLTPTGGPQQALLRSGLVAGALLAAMLCGLLATPASSAAVSLVLVAVQLRSIGVEVRLPWRRQAGPVAAPLPARPARDARHQLVRDFWSRPLPAALALLGAQAALVALDHLALPESSPLGDDGPGLLYVGSTLVLSIALGWVGLRPMGSVQAVAGVFGKTGYRPGDFAAAWSVLPVRREWILRGVYLHGLVACATIWAVAAGTYLASHLLDGGSLATALAPDKPFVELFVPLVAVVPCIAGLLAASAAARKTKTALAAVAMLAVFHGYFVLLILKVPVAVRIAYLVAMAALGGLPVLADLRRSAAREG